MTGMTTQPHVHHGKPGHMDISLRNLAQLFNSLDPSPFYDKDLDADAEHFIVTWVDEIPRDAHLSLALHLKEFPADPAQRAEVVAGIHQYFRQRERLARADLHTLLRQGRLSLLIGLSFLTLCLFGSERLAALPDPLLWTKVLGESLLMAGWVAMWQPLQIYLYDWWPLRQRELDYRRLGGMTIELRPA